MKFFSTLLASVLIVSVAAAPVKQKRDTCSSDSSTGGNNLAASGGAAGLSLSQIDALTPQFGFNSGVNPTGTGDCDGAVTGSDGKPIKVPCSCPPARDLFIQDMAANIAAGHAVNNTVVSLSFPTDNSVASQLARFNAASVTLQNLRGPGQGCPVASTTFSAQTKAIQNGQAPPAAAAPPPASPPAASTSKAAPAKTTAAPAASTPAASSGGALSTAQVDALAPQLGFTAGKNPTGTGDCDGAVNGADGKPIKVPCSCPPSRDVFIQSLTADVNAGHAVNNPSVGVSFPTDNSKNSEISRIQAALVALQNLNGEGKGCPAASTTLSAQLKALTG